VVEPTEPHVEADPFAPTEPNVKAQVLFTTADMVASSGPNAAADVMVTTADTAPTEANISEVGSVAWPAAQRHVRLGPPSPRRVEGPKRGSPAAAAIAPTEANFEAQVSSVQAVVFAPTEPKIRRRPARSSRPNSMPRRPSRRAVLAAGPDVTRMC
jgi:hypothetical protein